MSTKRIGLLGVLTALACLLGRSAEAPEDKVLVVGTKEAPPFVMPTAEGGWTGISIELWERIAGHLDLRYELRTMELGELIEGVTDGSLDAAVAAVTVTEERERLLDFSHPYYHTGLGIAVGSAGGSFLSEFGRVFSLDFVLAIGLLSLLLLAVGAAIWLFERRKNQEQFGGSAWEGIGSGFWWSAVTMTTVGYGDKAPRTFLGRLVGLVWMFAAIILISSFTAMITSALTVSRLGSPIQGPGDLAGARVGAVANSTGETYLKSQSIVCQTFPDPSGALGALAEGRLDAVVYDWPILKYLTREKFAGKVAVLPSRFLRQDYAIALPEDSALMEELNRWLMHEVHSSEAQRILERYLGSED